MSVARLLPSSIPEIPWMNRSNILIALFSAAVLAAGCSSEKKASAAQPRVPKAGSVPPRPAVVPTPTGPHRVINVPTPGRIPGPVAFEGFFPADSVIVFAANQTDCGQSVVDHRVDRSGQLVSGVAVWL